MNTYIHVRTYIHTHTYRWIYTYIYTYIYTDTHKIPRSTLCLVCCSVLQCVAVCCSVLQCTAHHFGLSAELFVNERRIRAIRFDQCLVVALLQCVIACCNLYRCFTVRYSVLQRLAVWCNVLQCRSTSHSRPSLWYEVNT